MGSSNPTATKSRVLGGTLQGGGGNEKKNGERRNDDVIVNILMNVDRDHDPMIDTATGDIPGNIDYDHGQDHQSGNHDHQHWQWRSIDLTSHQKWNSP
jgi:hypothetical protein